MTRDAETAGELTCLNDNTGPTTMKLYYEIYLLIPYVFDNIQNIIIQTIKLNAKYDFSNEHMPKDE